MHPGLVPQINEKTWAMITSRYSSFQGHFLDGTGSQKYKCFSQFHMNATSTMFWPMVEKSPRRNYLVSNTNWKSFARAFEFDRPSINNNVDSTNNEILKKQRKSVQEQDRDAACSLLLLKILHRHERKEIMNPESRPQRGQDLPPSMKSSLFDSLMEQEQWNKRLEIQKRYSASRQKFHIGYSNSRLCADEHKWNQRMKEVKDFVLEHGNGEIPTSYPRNQGLAKWSKRQRYHYKVYLKNKKQMTLDFKFRKIERCQMTPNRIKILNDAGFCFDLQAEKWDRNYEVLKRSKLDPMRHTNNELRRWIDTQRNQMSMLKRGKKSYINPERIQKLNDIGFVWQDDWGESKSKKCCGKNSPTQQQEEETT